MAELVWSDDLLAEARRTRDDVAAELAAAGVRGELVLTGGLSVPGALTKGDVDLHLRVEPARFADTVARLQRRYAVGSPHAWAPTLAVFDVPGTLPTGLAVTPVGSEHDDRFTSTWQALRENPDLLARYNALKATTRRCAEPRAPQVRLLHRPQPRTGAGLIESGHRDTREITGADVVGEA